MHRPAAFAALLGLTRAASAIGDFWVQNDFRARVKGASDDAPVTYEDPATKEKTTHGTADGRKACLHHCVTYTATQAIVAGFGARALGIRVHPGAAAATLALSFGTHYIADRRVPGHGDLRELHQVHGRLFMCGPELRGLPAHHLSLYVPVRSLTSWFVSGISTSAAERWAAGAVRTAYAAEIAR
ncbi:hypothetical protein ACPZ13_00585 [Streptomyces sp. IPPR8]|uniref:hypothetical protein n=1 Tax=unclassified Streptomyces TaxID=2593676 RepID=UPI0021AE4DE9|nr:hypothetical protein [Streptomyces sp. WAC06128]